MSKVLDDFTKQMGVDWYVDDELESNVMYAFDPSKYLSIFDTSGKFIKIISMYPKDEIVIKIKKSD